MTSSALPFQQHLMHEPTELTGVQRWALTGVVVLAHVGAAAFLAYASPEVVMPAEQPAITVDLIAAEPQVQAVQPPTPDVPKPVVKPKPVPPPPKIERQVVSSSKSQAVQQAAPEPKPVVPPPPAPVEPAAPAEPAPPAPSVTPPVAPTGPTTAAPVSQSGSATTPPRVLPSSAVRYLVPPVLNYPRTSRDLGEEGVVRLKVLVDEQGRPKDIEVVQSAGYPRLDQQAVQAMRRARFQPHIEDGRARMVWVMAPLTFKLES